MARFPFQINILLFYANLFMLLSVNNLYLHIKAKVSIYKCFTCYCQDDCGLFETH